MQYKITELDLHSTEITADFYEDDPANIAFTCRRFRVWEDYWEIILRENGKEVVIFRFDIWKLKWHQEFCTDWRKEFSCTTSPHITSIEATSIPPEYIRAILILDTILDNIVSALNNGPISFSSEMLTLALTSTCGYARFLAESLLKNG